MNQEEKIAQKIALMRSSDVKTLATRLGITLTKVTPERVEGTMPVDERTKQPFGILHGGASVALAETLASIGAWLNVDEERFDAVGLEINANHLRSVSSGLVTGVALPIHRGSKVQVWEIGISDEAGKKVCISRCTMAVIEKRR